MSEWIYAVLFRLYPAHFREAHGEEAMQLFRDRSRDEKGFRSGLRLWIDLLGDLTISVPREYWNKSTTAIPSRLQHCSEGAPLFHPLEHKSLSFGSLFYGGVVSLVVYGSVLYVMGSGRSHFRFADSGFQPTPQHSEMPAKSTPTIVFSFSPAKPKGGSIVTLSATVTGVGNRPTPTGTVRFLYGYTHLTAGALSNGVVTVNGKVPKPNTLSLRALYLGDANYNSVISTDDGSSASRGAMY